MRADKADEHHPSVIVNYDNQSKIVALDVEDNPVVGQKTCVTVRGFDLRGACPVGPACLRVPSP